MNIVSFSILVWVLPCAVVLSLQCLIKTMIMFISFKCSYYDFLIFFQRGQSLQRKVDQRIINIKRIQLCTRHSTIFGVFDPEKLNRPARNWQKKIVRFFAEFGQFEFEVDDYPSEQPAQNDLLLLLLLLFQLGDKRIPFLPWFGLLHDVWIRWLPWETSYPYVPTILFDIFCTCQWDPMGL